jgi:predicted RNA-binding Zn-ribbon protein involved in translation (DUF1610 family)
MTYEDFILSKVIHKNVEHYDLLMEAMLQTSIAPSTYLADKLNKQAVSRGLTSIFGEQAHKDKNTSFNFYFLKQYREEVLGIYEDAAKVCSSCKVELPIGEFYSNGYQPNGKKKYKSKCKQCQTVQNKNRVENIIIEVAGSYSCNICGYNKCTNALEFHHIDPSKKEYLISDLKTCSKEILVEELKKCIIVCSNCHREIHYGMHPEYLI